MKLTLQNMTDESLSVSRDEGMNRSTGTSFNVLEKVGTENNFFWHTWEHTHL